MLEELAVSLLAAPSMERWGEIMVTPAITATANLSKEF